MSISKESKFKAGDDVVCIDDRDAPLVANKIYKVERDAGTDLKLIGVIMSWRKDRFRIAELKDILKPWQRVKTRNGEMWIVMPSVQKYSYPYTEIGDLCLSREGVWVTIGELYTEYQVVEVFNLPEFNNNMLNPEIYGTSIWKETPPEEIVETETQKAMKALEATIKESQEKLELLKKTL